MEIREIINKTSRILTELLLIIVIIIINVQKLFKESVFINLCTALLIAGGILGFFAVLNHLNNRLNNKCNAIAVGYVIIAILLMIKLYYNAIVFSEEIQIIYSGIKVQFIIDLLEIMYIIVGVQYIGQHTNIKKFILLNGVVLIVSIVLSYRVELFRLFSVSLSNLYSINILMRSMLFIMTIIFLLVFCYKACNYRGISRNRVLAILLLHIFYQGSYIVFEVNGYLRGAHLLSIIKIAFYLNVFLFIHHDTVSIMRRSIDEDLEDKTRKLVEDVKQKTTLILVSEKLQEYIEIISHVTSQLKKKAEASNDLKRLKYLNMIRQNSYRLKKITHNIRAINQIEKGDILPQFECVDIVSLLEQLIESIEPYASSMHIRVKFEAAEHPIYCYLDKDLIERMILNLISNAIKYNKENGFVTIYANIKKENAYVCVKDTGLGIPHDKLDTIFNRFERGGYTLSHKREGSGLGLAIAKSLVEIHKGTIHIASKENEGTIVSIELPKCSEMLSNVHQYDLNDKEELNQKIKVEFSDLKL